MSNIKAERYGAYEDSGNDWLGEIPSHWNLIRLKEILSVASGDGVTPIDSNFRLGLYPIYGGNGIMGYTDKYNNSKSALVIGRVGAKCGNVHHVNEKIWISDNALIAKSKFNNFFLKYALNNFNLNKLSSANAQPLITGGNVKNQILAIPKPIEADQIVIYLDTKTAQIDRQIDLLGQKATQYGKLKQSLINETVTRGLDKTVPMKDSGVAWIGEVPEHWEVKRVKEMGILVLGKMLDNTPDINKFYKPYLKSKNIGWLKVTDSNIEEMYFSPYEIPLYRIKEDDLLFSEGGEVGKTSIWKNEISECYIQNSVHKFTANKNNNSRYLLYLSFSAGQANYYDSIVNFVSIKHLTKEKLSRVEWLSPPLSEQTAIATYLDEKTAKIDHIVTTLNNQIDQLKDLRKALINDVVTGKIKVVTAHEHITGESNE